MPSPFREAVCVECGTPFRTRSLAARTCSRRCSARMRQLATPNLGRPQIRYPAELVDQVRALYESGSTQDEVAIELGVSQKVVWRLMERHGIERRPAIPRNQSGPSNPSWKGNDANYQALHLRVEIARGKPKCCSCCDTTDPNVKYEWANLSGRYTELTDYARLCVLCHRRLDAARRESTGQLTSPRRRGEGNV